MRLRLICLYLIFAPLQAVGADAALQDLGEIRAIAENFALRQTADLPGQVTVTAGAVDSRLRLTTCSEPEAFLPAGSRLWGAATVGVRCRKPASWTIYVPVSIKVMAGVVVAARSLPHGQVIGQADILTRTEDITQLPGNILNDPLQAIGKTLAGSVPSGYPLRADALRSPLAVTQGQIVKVVAQGRGFRVSSEGKALANATEGQTVTVRTSSGQIVSGTARAGGIVEVPF